MIKEKIWSYWWFRPKGHTPDHENDEYGLAKLDSVKNESSIYLETTSEVLKESLRQMEEEFSIYKYSSRYQIPFSLSFNRGYLVENYFLKAIRRSKFRTNKASQARAFLIPATPYMYYVIIQMVFKVLQFFSFKGFNRKDTKGDFDRKRKWEERLLRGALDPVLRSDAYQRDKGRNHIYFSSKLGTEFLQKVNPQIFEHASLVVNSADAKRGHFDFSKDVSSVCMMDYKIPQYAYDIAAFDMPYAERKHYTYYAGMLYGYRRSIKELKTENCHWIEGHVPFEEYLRNYSESKFYLHLPGSSEWSPRLFEGMWFGAVPVVIYDQYTLPFSDVLDWSKFAVIIHMDQIRQIYEILDQINEEQWREKRRCLKQSLKHFCYHKTPILGDAFYMTLYAVYQRLENAQ